ncbi:MAG: hypothetical protein A4E57_02334 [Syntrophorhabdaceae bacterium PtaU1.Bin034]|nr:MAG: hypothetical protein A4E57_02334 [Syntrophorhabdaceae bacterium PtaU1.Bin034]
MIIDVVWAFFTGLTGSLHCLGMCGPLVVAYALHLRGEVPEPRKEAAGLRSRALLRYHAAFHAGRIAAYALTGAVVASLVSLAASAGSFRAAGSILSLAGGSAMVVLGLVLLRAFPSSLLVNGISPSSGTSFFGKAVAALLRSTTTGSRLLLGFAAGFLPCMLSWGVAARAATTGNALTGLSLMASFGLGTTPALLFTGFFASYLTVRMRLAGERLAAVSVIIMGFILIWKGANRLV